MWCENEVCKVQGLKKGDHILTIQAHPEFSSDVLKKLLEVKKEVIPAPLIEKALETVDNPVDSTSFSNWVYDFFTFSKN